MGLLAAIAAIVLTGLDANNPTPGVYLETNFAAGPVAGSSGAYPIVVLANKLPSGSATADTTIYGVDTPVTLQTENDMLQLAGAGSEAHRMFLRITALNKVTSVYWVFVSESAGSNATGTITLTTAPTGVGTLRIWVGDDFVDTSITSGMTVAALATAAIANVNAKTRWAVTAVTGGSGIITLTSKQKGLRGNWLRFQSAVLTTVSGGIGTTTSATTDGFLTGGTTADSNTTALATILPRRLYYIVSAAEDATQLGAAATQVNTQALPTNGKRQRLFGGTVDTLSNAITIAIGVNAARSEITWAEKSPWTPAELAANAAAIYALLETKPNPRTNFVEFGNGPQSSDLWLVPRSRVDAAAPTGASIISALNNGLSPVAWNTNGSTYLVNRITTRSLSGSTPDFRIRAAHKVTICDFFGDDLQAKLAASKEGKRIENDPPKGAPPPGANVATPMLVRGQVFGLIDTYAANDLLQNVQDIKDGTVVQRETNPTTRMGIRIPLEPVDNWEQAAIALDQVA